MLYLIIKPLHMQTSVSDLPGLRKVAVIGAGVAGISAAATLKQSGVDVDVYEKEHTAGGHLNHWHALFPGRESAARVRKGLLQEITAAGLHLRTSSGVKEIIREAEGFRVTTDGGDSREYGALVLATGFRLFDASLKEEYGYGIYPQVITSPDLERRMEEGGEGLAIDGCSPGRVAFVHCVGSRDAKAGNLYCSRVCCITGVKQAISVKERYPSCEVVNFYMDLRMFDSGYEELYQEAQEKYGITFIRGRVSEAAPTRGGTLQVKAEDTLLGRPMKITADWMVLLVGMEPSIPREWHEALSLNTDVAGFAAGSDKFLRPGESSARGVFIAGACAGPASIPESVNQGRAAALSVVRYLNSGE